MIFHFQSFAYLDHETVRIILSKTSRNTADVVATLFYSDEVTKVSLARIRG